MNVDAVAVVLSVVFLAMAVITLFRVRQKRISKKLLHFLERFPVWADEMYEAEHRDILRDSDDVETPLEMFMLRQAWRRSDLLARRLDLAFPEAAKAIKDAAKSLAKAHEQVTGLDPVEIDRDPR